MSEYKKVSLKQSWKEWVGSRFWPIHKNKKDLIKRKKVGEEVLPHTCWKWKRIANCDSDSVMYLSVIAKLLNFSEPLNVLMCKMAILRMPTSESGYDI